MAALFKRFYKPAVQLSTPEGLIRNLDSNGLRFDWNIQRDNTSKVDTGTVTIYNLAPALYGAIHTAWRILSRSSGYLVEFGLGFDGVTQTVIRGDVTNLIPNRRSDTDVLTIFEIGDGAKATRDQVVGKSFSGVKLDVVLSYIIPIPVSAPDIGGGGLGLLYPLESRAIVAAAAAKLSVQQWGNIPAGYNMRDAVSLIMDTLGLEWRVHNGAFIAMQGGIINRPGPILTPSNGLINYEERDDGGALLSAFANPDVEPGIQVQVFDNLGKPYGAGLYRVETVGFEGSSDEGSLMNIGARKAVLV